MKTYYKYIILLAGVCILFILAEVFSPKPIDWQHSFSSKHKIPYGCFILHRTLSGIFPEKQISTVDISIVEFLVDDQLSHSNYIFINDLFPPDPWETGKLLDFIRRGNNVFIAANRFSKYFEDSLDIKTNMKLSHFDTIRMTIVNTHINQPQDFKSEHIYTAWYFSEFDSSNATVIGMLNDSLANFLRIGFGKGNLFLNTIPLAFTNINMLNREFLPYISYSLSFLPIKNTFWDEYYKPGRFETRTPLRFILNRRPLAWAYYLLILMLALFIIFRARRKQRIVPVIEPFKNKTVEFVKTLANLYYGYKDHKKIAEKHILYFYDYIRQYFYTEPRDLSQTTYQALAAKSKHSVQEIETLFSFINSLNTSESISEQQLLELNKRIENFFEKVKGS